MHDLRFADLYYSLTFIASPKTTNVHSPTAVMPPHRPVGYLDPHLRYANIGVDRPSSLA